MSCVSCDSAPAPCACSSSQTCVQTPRNCTACPQNICISQSAVGSLPNGPSSFDPNSSQNGSKSSGIGGTIGGAVGGIVGGVVLVLVGWWLWRKGVFDRFFERHGSPLKPRKRHHPHHPSQRRSRSAQAQRGSGLDTHISSTSTGAMPSPSTAVAGEGVGGGGSKKRNSKHLIDVRFVDEDEDERRQRMMMGIGMATLRRNGESSNLPAPADDPFDDSHSSVPSVHHPLSPVLAQSVHPLVKTSHPLSTPVSAGLSPSRSSALNTPSVYTPTSASHPDQGSKKDSRRVSSMLPYDRSSTLSNAALSTKENAGSGEGKDSTKNSYLSLGDRFSCGLSNEFAYIIGEIEGDAATPQASASSHAGHASTGDETGIGKKIPAAYIPPDSKSLSIADVTRDPFGNTSAPQAQTPTSARPTLSRSPSSKASLRSNATATTPPAVSGAAGFKLPQIPAPSASSVGPAPAAIARSNSQRTGPAAPSRPPRAPGLDLKLPEIKRPSGTETLDVSQGDKKSPAAASRFSSSTVDTLQLARASDASVAGGQFVIVQSPSGHSLAPVSARSVASHVSTTEGLASPLPSPGGDGERPRPTSEAPSEVSSMSHLSSILDPATIVTPISRDAAHRQKIGIVPVSAGEKVKVVKIPAPLNSAGIGSSGQGSPGLSPLSTSTVGKEKGPRSPLRSVVSASEEPKEDEEDPFDDSSAVGSARHLSGVSLWSDQPHATAHSELLSPASARSAAPWTMPSASGSHDSVASDASFLLSGVQFAERVQIPVTTALGSATSQLSSVGGHAEVIRTPIVSSSTSTPTSVASVSGKGPMSPLFPTPPPRTSPKASPIQRPSNLPQLPLPNAQKAVQEEQQAAATSSGDATQNAGSPTPLPEPFKPFAGQKPTNMTASSSASPLRSSEVSPFNIDHRRPSMASSIGTSGSRLSSTSSVGVRSGYGSVLEDIPFNIGIGGLGTGSFLAGPDSDRGSVLSDVQISSPVSPGGPRGLSIISTLSGLGSDEDNRFSDVPVGEMPRLSAATAAGPGAVSTSESFPASLAEASS